MTVEGVLWFVDLFDRLGITVWLDGGWCVDALLGEQTRPHADLDIMIPAPDAAVLEDALRRAGFGDVHTDDHCAENFVLGHSVRGLIDFHVFELAVDGHGVYRPGVYDWKISADELAGSGSLGGRLVRCLSAEYQVRSHAGYPLQKSDLHDLALIRDRLGVRLHDEQERLLKAWV